MKKIIVTVILTLVVLLLGFIIFIYSGTYNVSQLSHHNSITAWAIKTTVSRSIDSHSKALLIPPMNDSSNFKEGFSHYNEMCVTCHAAPGIQPDELAKGLYPSPPLFYKSNKMPGAAYTFWVIKNGIKFTSMPAFGPTHSDEKIGAITDFILNKLNKMSPQEYRQWQEKYGKMGN